MISNRVSKRFQAAVITLCGLDTAYFQTLRESGQNICSPFQAASSAYLYNVKRTEMLSRNPLEQQPKKEDINNWLNGKIIVSH